MYFSSIAHRAIIVLAAIPLVSQPGTADSSGPSLASYYGRHMAIVDGAAFGWIGSDKPKLMLEGVKQVGVSRDSYLALKDDGTLLRWTSDTRTAEQLMFGVSAFSSGQSGVFGIDANRVLWLAGTGHARRRIADSVIAASIGDGTDYYVTAEGHLYVKGNAHRGQYGDGRLQPTAEFVRTAFDAVDVKSHTGHAIHLSRNGDVFGTGGNIYGPLSSHGLGDKAITWGKIFDGAKNVATGASHSAAIRKDGSLWIWGAGYGTTPHKIFENVTAVAAGSFATIARTADGMIWQLEAGKKPNRVLPIPH